MQLLYWGGALICIVLTACENFLKGQEVKEQILDTIAYNNAPSCKVLLKSDPAMGEFLSNGEQIFKVGYGSEIQFSVVKSAYCFTGFEAVSKIDPDVSYNEFVKFENPVNDDEKGIYKIKVKVLKKMDDICIRPVCIELPCVTEYSPASGENAANVQINISFNIPMDQQSLTFDSGNITISSGSTNLNYLFDDPVLSVDGKTLTISPKASELYDYIKESNIKVNVEFSEDITVTKTINEKEYVLSLKQNENSRFSVVYKKEKETTAPVNHGFFVTRMLTPPASGTEQDFANVVQSVYDSYKYSTNTLTTPLDYYKNSSDGSFYIYGRFFDESGISSIEVVEKHTHNLNGQDITKDPETTPYYKNSQNAWFFTKDGYTEFFIKHILKSEDGEYNITVNVNDSCKNTTSQSFTAIKSVVTMISKDKIELYNVTLDGTKAKKDYYLLEEGNNYNWYTKQIVKSDYKNSLKNIKIDKIQYSFYKNLQLQDLFRVECSYLNNNKQVMTWNEQQQRYEYNLEVEDISELAVNIKIYQKNYDETYSLQFEKNYYFPPLPTLYGDCPRLYNSMWDDTYGSVSAVYIEPGKNIDTIYRFIEDNYDAIEYMGDSYTEALEEGYSTRLAGIKFTSEQYQNQYNKKNGFIMYKNGGLCSDFTKLNNLKKTVIFAEDDYSYPTLYGTQIISEAINTEDPNYVDITIQPVLKDNLADYITQNVFAVLSRDGWITDIIHVFDEDLTPVTFKYPLLERNKDTYFYICLIHKNKHTQLHYIGVKLDARTDIETEVEINPSGFVRYKTSSIPDYTYRYDAKQDAASFFTVYDINDAGVVFCPGTIKQELKDLSSINGNIYVKINNSEEVCYTTNKCILKDTHNNTLISHINNFIFIPAWELDKDENTITIRYEGTDQNTATKTFTWQQQNLPSYVDDDFISLAQKYYDYYDTQTNKWINYYNSSTNQSSEATNTITKNKYYRKSQIYLPMNGGFSYYYPISYVYDGTPSSGAKTDKFIKNGDLYLIASDQPVLMQTYITTTNSYNDCKSWNIEQWQKNHRRIDEIVLTFSPETCHSLQYYCPDTSCLAENTCYVIVARYADGHIKMSEVMQK